MLNIVKETSGNVLIVRMTGSIEESVNFEQLIGPPPKEMRVICKEVPRINSVGVKAWIKYFQACHNAGTKLTFAECSTAIVEQMNLISNFTGGGTVESIYIPFACGGCKSELVGLFKTQDIIKVKGQIPDLKCTKCGGKAAFDDIPEEYFSFLKI